MKTSYIPCQTRPIASSVFERKIKTFARKLDNSSLLMFEGHDNAHKASSARYLSKILDLEMYNSDLGKAPSREIGETQKNLQKIVHLVSGERCVIFFDNADALFGNTRTCPATRVRFDRQELSCLFEFLSSNKDIVIFSTPSLARIENSFLVQMDMLVSFPPRRMWTKQLKKFVLHAQTR